MNPITSSVFLAVLFSLFFSACDIITESGIEDPPPTEDNPPEDEYEPKPTDTEHLIVVTVDGVRWQEIFAGADSALIHNHGYISGNPETIKAQYWADTKMARREALMPFLWTTFVEEGKLYGNREYDNKVYVTNSSRKSIPGYAEIWTGHADPFINANNTPPNSHINVLEFLNHLPGFKGNKVQAIVPTEGFKRVLNVDRSKLLVHNVTNNDSTVFKHTMDILEHDRPRVVYMAIIQTDHWAHQLQYDTYLTLIHEADSYIASIWDFVQQDDFYMDRTTLLITTDHGRGIGSEWHTHGADGGVHRADETWFAIVGPDTKPSGEQKDENQIQAIQFAKTMAALLEFNFNTGSARGEPIESVMDRSE